MEVKEVMTRKEAAEYIQISLSQFAKIQKYIPHIQIGKIVRFKKRDIDAYLESKIEFFDR